MVTGRANLLRPNRTLGQSQPVIRHASLPIEEAAPTLSIDGSSPTLEFCPDGVVQLELLASLRVGLAGRYEVDEEVGRGGMASVFRGRELKHNRLVAIKVLHPDLARAVAGERFHREILHHSQLSHSNILPLLDSGTFEVVPGLELPWYSMPYVAGENLRARLNREGALPMEVALRYTREICSALAYVHGRGHDLIHRDIKPENILLQGDQAVLADFGIARAVHVAGGDKLSSTGIVVGTPEYMSPEQSTGSPKVDGRSDLYSLGCVLYEMLAGDPPFTGSTPQAISAKHQFEKVPSIRVVRPTVPAALDRVIEKVLAKIPGDRFKTAAELSRALEAGANPRTERMGASARWAVLGAVVVFAVLAVYGSSRLGGRPALNPSLYVVLPFHHDGGAETPLLSGDNCRELVSDALDRWIDVGVVSSLSVTNALNLDQGALTLSRALAVARQMQAGRVVWGTVTLLADSIRVQGALYDAGSGRELRTHSIRFASATTDLRELAKKFADLTYALVLPDSNAPDAAADALGAKSIAAYKLYSAGDSALNEWNLDLAKRHFHEALDLDPEFPNANLKLAQVGEWLEDPAGEWRSYAARAAAAPERLVKRDRIMAAAMLALSDAGYPEACRLYRSMVQDNPLDFRGWYGLGDCLTSDDVVLPDSAHPSGWRFRSSYAAGIAAFTRALTLVPSTHLAYGGAAIGRLSTRLMAEPNMLRFGKPVGDSTWRFAAYPSLAGDSLTFIPLPIADAVRGDHTPTTWVSALEANRRSLLAITTSWLRNYPRSRPALLAQAEALEMLGRLDDAGPDRSALALVSQLRQGATADDAVMLAARNARLLLKLSRFGAARAVAESVLATPPRAGEEELVQAGLAALIGRADRAAELLARYSDVEFTTSEGKLLLSPPELAAEAHRLMVYAGFGTPVESLTAISGRVRSLVANRVEQRQRSDMLDALLFQPSLLAFPLIPTSFKGSYRLAAIERQLGLGDRRGGHAALDSLATSRLAAGLALVVPDFALLEARLWSLAGDTVAARKRVEVMLDSPRSWNSDLLSQVSQAAAIGRAMEFYRMLGPDPRNSGLDTALTALWGSNRRHR